MKIKSIHYLRGGLARLIVFLGFVFVATSAKADQWGDWTYTTDGRNVTITGYVGVNSNEVVPDEISGQPVRNIGNNTFFNKFSLKSVDLGTNLVSIGDNAFGMCTNLASINIPASVTNIGFQAFYYCFGMTNLQLGMATPYIGKWAFVFCWNLPSIGVHSNNPAYASRDGVLFNKDETQLIACPGGVSGSYEIPNSVTQIAYSAFSSCGSIAEVIIPNSVTYVGEHAFGGCASITNAISLENVTSLREGAFYNCKKIPSVRLGNGITTLETNVFFWCEGLTNIVMPSVTNIQYEAFWNCTALTAAYFWGNEPVADPSALFGCNSAVVYYYPWTTGWTNTFCGRPTVPMDISYTVNNGTVTITGYTGTNSYLVIPNTISNMSVVAVGDWAFSNKTTITGVSFPASLSNIGTGAFLNCYSLQSITIPPNVTNVGTYAFMNCLGLSSLVLSNGVTSLQDFSFFTCTNLTSIAIPASVSFIGTGVFGNEPSLQTFTVSPSNPFFSATNDILFDKNLTRLIQCPASKKSGLTIPPSVVNIGGFSFGGCFSLTNMVIPNGVTNIGQYAFYSCSSLTNMVVPASVVTIGSNAFSWATRLTNIVFKGNPPAIALPVFDWDDALTVYYYPWTSGWTGSFGGRPTQVMPAYTQWLTDFGFSTNLTEDNDNDGMLNWQEFLSHTDPTTNIDLLAITSMWSETNVQISWLAKSNVSYQVMKSIDLMVAWSNAPSGIGGNQQSYQTTPADGLLLYDGPDVAGSANAFYRVNVVP
jgi:hypothetical protein